MRVANIFNLRFKIASKIEAYTLILCCRIYDLVVQLVKSDCATVPRSVLSFVLHF
uniref:Uncharacterized protein n=1 Tax=uncultured prokaryote TaxID=198431 RepID=A0A0H5PZQ9_9ZZZZ|nr:hypothetical protein [uncultured prokaryote]